jgi:hypothetical protein
VERFAGALFDLDATELESWPGLQTYLNHLKERLKSIGSGWIHPATEVVEIPGQGVSFHKCLKLISELCLVIKSAANDSSIDDTLRLWVRDSVNGDPQSSTVEWRAWRQALFCVLASVTLLAEVSEKPRDDCFEVQFPDSDENDNDSRTVQRLDSARRPVSAMMRWFCKTKFKFHSGTARLLGEGDVRQDLISVSAVSYAMLHEFGKISIEWTTLISCHLLFVPSTRTLYLFRLPTFCALACIKDGKNCLFDQ